MAAALLQTVVVNHALVAADTQLGWVSAAVLLEVNGVRATRIANDAVDEFVMWIAAANPDLVDIVGRQSSLLVEAGAVDGS